MLYKPVKSSIQDDIIKIKTETGHIVKFKIKSNVFIDLDNEESSDPFFFCDFKYDYIGVENTNESKKLKDVKNELINRNILTDNMDYSFIDIGFIYAEDGFKDNHRWQINLVNKNGEYVYSYIGDEIEVNCKFSTRSWEDNIWHGRITINKDDVKEILELKEGKFIINGTNDKTNYKLIQFDPIVDDIQLRFNINTNLWYVDMFSKKSNIGQLKTSKIICDVPFTGKVDKNFSKPKVTVKLDFNKIKGISFDLDTLIIKT